MTISTAVILAGGLGTRLRDVVSDVPKSMAPINNRPFLEYQLDYWINQGINHFVLSTGYRHEMIMNYFGSHYKNAKLEYVIEAEPLGTGGGLLLAAHKMQLQQPFLLLNGDTYFTVDLKRLNEFAVTQDADWCFSLFRAEENQRYLGLEVSPQGKIIQLSSKPSTLSQLINAGVYWVNPRVLKQDKFLHGDKFSLEYDFFTYALNANKRLLGLEFMGNFIDIGLPVDYQRAFTLLT